MKTTLEEKVEIFAKQKGEPLSKHFINMVIKGEKFDANVFESQKELEIFLEETKGFLKLFDTK